MPERPAGVLSRLRQGPGPVIAVVLALALVVAGVIWAVSSWRTTSVPEPAAEEVTEPTTAGTADTGDAGGAGPTGGSTGDAAVAGDASDDGAAVDGEQAADEVEHVAAVVSAHELATQAGVEILAEGGTAADAAVGVAAALSVVEPWFSSALGGGTWALYREAGTGEVTALDGVGPAGSEATLERYVPQSGDSTGMHQAVVPGAWDGWMLWLERYGELDLGQVLAPAIRIAREGYPVYPDMEEWLDRSGSGITGVPEVADIYVVDGRRVQEGDTVRQVEMAETFEALVAAYDGARDQGREAAVQAARDHFYRGPVAEAIVAHSDANGGFLTLDDLNSFEAEIVDAISVDYRDVTVYQNPPNSQGISQLIATNILEGFDFSGMEVDDPLAVHRQVEAMKLAFADRYAYVGDPDVVHVPVEEMLSDEHAARQRERIEPDDALEWPIESTLGPVDSHTTTFHVVDDRGNGAAVTTSLGAQFVVIGDTGIHINNRMRFFSHEEGNPNVLEPGKKVRHTSNPYLVTRADDLYILGGNTGVDTQAQGQLQQFMSVVEFGLGAQEAISRPRWVSRAFPASTVSHQAPNTLQVEGSMSEALRDGLRERGHDLAVDAGVFGSAAMIVVSEDGGTADVGRETRSEVTSGVVVEPDR